MTMLPGGRQPLTVDALFAAADGAASDADAAIAMARLLLSRASRLQTPQERRQQAELNRMISHPDDKATLVEMTDQAFRTTIDRRVADQLTHILDVQGVPRFFSGLDRTMLRGFQSFGGFLPGVAVPLVKDKMRRETANVILPAEPDLLAPHLRERQAEGLRMNVNVLGEALIGENEARRRLSMYLAAVQQPAIECLSVKVSTIYSQLNAIARSQTVQVLAARLEMLFRTAARERFTNAAGVQTTKFVYLDMEEYRDMYLTRDALIAALNTPGLESVRAGIALQAYIPDSYAVLLDLAAWSRQRVAAACHRGQDCQPLTVRIVKGANMEMERVEASIMGWPQAPYRTKEETDANFKRMVREALRPENAASLRVGIASHNLFDVALAMLWAARCSGLGTPRVQFEMLEGMANHQRRALFECVKEFLLYAPACYQEDFLHAIGYLIRRLDENTGAENFLRHTFQLDPAGAEFATLANAFRQSVAAIERVSAIPRRTQDRRQPPQQPPPASCWQAYVNEPDTDWSLPHHAAWAEGIVSRWKSRCDEAAVFVPLRIGGEDVHAGRPVRSSPDPSRPGTVACRYREATEADVERAVACSRRDSAGWRTRPHEQRHATLRAAAQLMRERRGDLIGSALADGGKTIAEADPEVSEAIDFTEFYPLAAAEFFQSDQFQVRPRGVVVVVSPWNFPLAIPCGGVTAALAAGNTVILKPASDTVLPAWMICQCLWDAGVPLDALQLVPCPGATAGQQLVTHDDVDLVILTGGTETAQRMLEAKPDLQLLAETGGKNATIITALADRDLAIKHVLHSAFGHAGQKCSATSLLLLEAEIYDDPSFRRSLADAVESLSVGSTWDLSTTIGPVIRPPEGALLRSLKELEHGEEWLVMSEQVAGNPRLYRPCVKWNVAPDSFTHMTELFGPVLGVMRFERLEEAIELVNRTGYGLTSGLESLDDREQTAWAESIRAGNLYINRSTTGAIVLRQPFGGMGKSAWGPGIKAGGPNYVVPLLQVEELPLAHRRPSLLGPSSPPTAAASTECLERSGPPQVSTPADVLTHFLRTLADDRRCSGLQSLCHGPWADALVRLRAAAENFKIWAKDEYLAEHDAVRLVGQDNRRRYRPVDQLRLRVVAGCPADDIIVAVLAAISVGCRPVLSIAPTACPELVEALDSLTHDWAGRIEFVEENTAALTEEIRRGFVDRIRLPAGYRADAPVLAACRDTFVPIIDQPILAIGRVEPLWYLREQSLSMDYHRYGNLGRRAGEARRPIL